MKIVVLGTGIAASALIKNVKNHEVIVITRDDVLPYYRPRILELLKDKKIDDLIIKADYKNAIFKLEETVEKLDFKAKKVITNKDSYSYDKLVIALGAEANFMSLKDDKDVLTIRSYKDVLILKDRLNTSKKPLVIGAGLLGLELAAACANDELKVKIVETEDRLLSGLLDKESSLVLEEKLKEMNLDFVYNAKSLEHKKGGLFLEDGRVIDSDLVLESIGIRSNIALCNNLDINRAIVVNEEQETSEKDVYAIGDVAELNGIVYGMMDPSIKQAEHLARILNNEASELDKIERNTILKIKGLPLIVLGKISDDCNKKDNPYEKFFFEDGILVGYISIGNMKNVMKVKSGLNKVTKEEVLLW